MHKTHNRNSTCCVGMKKVEAFLFLHPPCSNLLVCFISSQLEFTPEQIEGKDGPPAIYKRVAVCGIEPPISV